MTVKKLLKYELKLAKADIIDLDERMKGSDDYFKIRKLCVKDIDKK